MITQPLTITASSRHTPVTVHQLEMPTTAPCQHPPEKKYQQEPKEPAPSTHSLETTYLPELMPFNHQPINHHTPASYNHRPPETLYQLERNDPALSTHSPRTTYQPKLHEQALLNHPPTSHHTPTSYNQRPPDTLYHLERNDPAPSPHSPRTTDQRLGLHEQTPLNHTPINHPTPASYDHRPPETLYQLERNDAAPSPQSPTSKYTPELLARISSSIENAISNSSFGHRLDQMNRSMEEYIRKCNLELPN